MIYFDNSATTPLAPEVLPVMTKAIQNFGNPSSRHFFGLDASKILSEARRRTANAMNVSPDEIYFTSGGTESDNIAIFGGANIKKGHRIVTTAIEHPAVLRCFEKLEKEGFDVVFVKPHKDGSIIAEDILKHVTQDTSLVSIMHVNNETGAILPVHELKGAIKMIAPRALLHVDAVQSFGHIPFKPAAWGIDMASVSSHKIHGPKGIGALYIRKGVSLRPWICGGGQERNIRSGTENVYAAAGFGEACSLINTDDMKKAEAIKEYMKSELLKIEGTVYNGGAENESPYILNISFGKIRSEIMLNALSNEGICVSSGSACSSGKHKSHVLEAMGAEKTDSAIRFSFSRYNTTDEASTVIKTVTRLEKELRR